MTDTQIPCTTTRFGFDWGSAQVVRICDHHGQIILVVRTPRQELEIRVTPSGLIRTRVMKGHRAKEMP